MIGQGFVCRSGVVHCCPRSSTCQTASLGQCGSCQWMLRGGVLEALSQLVVWQCAERLVTKTLESSWLTWLQPYIFQFSHALPRPVAYAFTTDEDRLGDASSSSHYLHILHIDMIGHSTKLIFCWASYSVGRSYIHT